MIVYLDASAAAKLLVHEAESRAVTDFLRRLEPGTAVIASQLLETELRRLAARAGLPQPSVTALLSRVSLIHPMRGVWREAGVVPGTILGSLDALHLVTALREDASAMVTYDRRLISAAAEAGLETISP